MLSRAQGSANELCGFPWKGGGGQQRILQSYFKVYTFSEIVHAYYTLGMDKRSSSFFVMYL